MSPEELRREEGWVGRSAPQTGQQRRSRAAELALSALLSGNKTD